MENGESPFNVVNGSPAVIPMEIGMETYRIMTYDEEQHMGLLKENLDLIEEKREVARTRS